MKALYENYPAVHKLAYETVLCDLSTNHLGVTEDFIELGIKTHQPKHKNLISQRLEMSAASPFMLFMVLMSTIVRH